MRNINCPRCTHWHRLIVVVVRGGGYGVFRDSRMHGHKADSQYSTVLCLRCLYAWRTAGSVTHFPDAPPPRVVKGGVLIPGELKKETCGESFVPDIDVKPARRS